jgi:N-acetylmuramoyl-L-alanine amidase
VAVYQGILLKGEYVSKHERQQHARELHCLCVIEFHFNASTSKTSKGGEVYYKAHHHASHKFARIMWEELARIGLPSVHDKKPVKASADSPRTRWLSAYRMAAILIEPLFISNQDQAEWLHHNLGKLVGAVAAAIRRAFPKGGRVGLSPGHVGKGHRDPGALCAKGDHEADHTSLLATFVKIKLIGGEAPKLPTAAQLRGH